MKRWQYQQSAHVVQVIPPPTPPDWGMFSAMSQPLVLVPPARLFDTLFSEATLGIVEQAVTFAKALLFEFGVEPTHKVKPNELGTQATYLIQGMGTDPA